MCQRPPLTEISLIASVRGGGRDSWLTVARESIEAVMHERGELIRRIEVAEIVSADFLEVSAINWIDIFPMNLQVLVSVGMILHVRIAQSVNQLMLDGSTAQASFAIQRHILLTADSPDGRMTTVAVVKVHEIVLSGSVIEPNARVRLEIFHSVCNLVHLLLRCERRLAKSSMT